VGGREKKKELEKKKGCRGDLSLKKKPRLQGEFRM
jgi:hypothetical protein